MLLALQIATLLAAFASTALAHGYVSGIVANGVYTEGWQVAFWYDIVNKAPYPQTPGWYEEELDLGFIPPAEYQYVCFRVEKMVRRLTLDAEIPISSATRTQSMPMLLLQ